MSVYNKEHRTSHKGHTIRKACFSFCTDADNYLLERTDIMKKSRSLLKVSVVSIAALHGINKVIDSLSTAENNSKSNGKYYHWKHGSIYYRSFGEGSPLLLIHDLTVFSSSYEWSQVISSLAEHHTVYVLDLVGCGKSDKPEITYTNYFYVQMLNDFIADVIKQPVNIAATGLSSSFVLMANAINKNLFQKLILINPKSTSYLKQNPDKRSKILIKLFNLPVVGKTAYYIATNKENTEYYLTETCFYNPFHVKPDITKAFYNAAHTASGSGKMLLASIDGNYLNTDITNALKNSDNEITIVSGEHQEHNEDMIMSYSNINPSVHSEIISGAKLLPQLEAPEEFSRLLLQILN